jgi:hypothetical protein
MEGMRIEQGPVPLQLHSHIPKSPTEHTITAALGSYEVLPFLCKRRVNVMTVGVTFSMKKSLDCSSTQYQTRSAISEPSLDVSITVVSTG